MTSADTVVALDPPPRGAPANPVVGGLSTVGAATRRLLSTIGSEARFVGDVAVGFRDVRTWLPETTTQALKLGVQSLPIALFIAAFTGIVLALLASYSFTGAVPLYFVGTLVGKTIMLELAPVLTGLALAGRVGANIAAELGTMRVTEQIDALETLTYDPIAYLVVPRVLAGTLMFPLIVGAAMVVGVGAGWIASVMLLHLSSPDFVKGLRLFFQTFDAEYGLVKSASFGFAVTLIGSRRGLRAEGGATGVGRAATSAVVYSAVMILVLDAFWVVVVIVVALGGSLAWVKGTDVGKRQNEVIARFHDVGNARVGNIVVIRGVVGGRIQGIELAPAGWVDVRMKLDPSVQLPAEPVVLLNESSLFGEWQATIVERSALPHDETVRQQIADASREHGVLPGATLPGIGKLTAVAGQIAGDVANVAGRVEVAFDDQAARELRGSIRNVADLSKTLATTVRAHSSDLDTLSNQLRTTIATLNKTAVTVQGTAQRIDSAATSKQVRDIIENLSTASTELRHTSTQVRDLSSRFAVTQNRLDSFLANSDSVMVKINRGQGSLGLFIADPSMYRRSDSLLVQLRALIADIQANPKRYVSVKLF
jgi:ABC transport permease subunit